MNIIEREENGISIFSLDGRVDSEGAVDLDLALQTALSEGKYKLVLDMANTSYLNSSGLRTLADALTQSKEHGGNVYIVAANDKIRRVFEIIGFDNFFQSFDDIQSAVSTF